MTLTTAAITFFISWWLAFLAALPFGVRGIHETGEAVAEGVETAAPDRPDLVRKALVATGAAFVCVGLVWAAISFNLLSFLPSPPSVRD